MYTKTVEVTPQYAAKLLETIANPRNRRFDAKKLDQYQSDMRTPGKWITDTADFIRISKKGILLDGHHRLKAVVLSGTTQRFGFAYEVNDDAIDVIDGGKPRTVAQRFFMAGRENEGKMKPFIQAILEALSEKTLQLSFGQVEKAISEYDEALKTITPIFFEDKRVAQRYRAAILVAPFVFAHHQAKTQVMKTKVVKAAKEFALGIKGNGVSQPISVLRDHMGEQRSFAGARCRIPVFKKCLNAIKSYVRDEELEACSASSQGLIFFKGM